VATVVLGWGLVGGAYDLCARANRANNVRALADYITDPEAIGNGDEAAAIRMDDVAVRFATRPLVGLEKLPRMPNVQDVWLDSTRLRIEADELMASRYSFQDFPTVTLKENLGWDEDPLRDADWSWELHGMAFSALLARAYAETGNLSYLERAEALILDWIRDNSAYAMRPPSEFSWNDHTTAIRLVSWLYFWEVWSHSPLFEQRKMETVVGSMLAHADLLADSTFYWPKHNHGIDQDRTLLAFALVFPELDTSDEWKALALRRLALQLTQTISPNGVHLEYSPGYQLATMAKVEDIDGMLQAFSLEEALGLDLPGLLSKMSRFAAAVMKPNQEVAPLGDTPRYPLDAYPILSEAIAKGDPWLTYPTSGGASGILRDTVLAYPEEGYAMIRDFAGGTLSYAQSLYLLFAAASHEVNADSPERSHKHFDDLSFILSYRGRDYLIDPGRYSYMTDERRDYVVSSLAHSVVLVDGMGFTGMDSSLDYFATEPDYTVIRGSHRNYRDFEHARWVVHVKPAKLIVIDEMRPRAPGVGLHEFQQIFQLASDLDVEVTADGMGVVATPPPSQAAPGLRIEQLHGTSETRVVSGQEDPMLGWDSPAHGVVVPTPVAVFSTSGERAVYVTLLEFVEPSTATQAGAIPSDARASLSDEGFVVEWSDAGETSRLEVKRSGEVLLR
jgi:hypothetical protein